MNDGPPVVARPAATVILLRDSASGFEVLLVKRNPAARFMGGAWVFPGGALQPPLERGQRGLHAAALRELSEEAGIRLPADTELVPLSRWITPAEVRIRFDTWFLLARVEADCEARVDGEEVVEARWYAPARALAAGRAGEITLVFPTIKNLEELTRFDTAAELIADARLREIRPVLPRVREGGRGERILLPGEPGYD